jgi:hypothetical protein
VHDPWVWLKSLVCYSVFLHLTRNHRIQHLITLGENFSLNSHVGSPVSQEFSEEVGY